MIAHKLFRLTQLNRKSAYSFSDLVSRTQFENKPAELYSFYQASTNPKAKDNLVVFHGLFGSHTNFRTIVKNPAITDLVNSYSMDLRNHGLSEHKPTMSLKEMGEDIVNFLEQKNLRNVILMGHSLGGRAIMSGLEHYAKQLKPFVKGVIICDIAPGNLVSARTADVSDMWIMINSLLEINVQGKARANIDKEVRQAISNPQVAGFMMMNIVQDELNAGQYKWRVNLKAIRDFYKDNLGLEIKGGNWEGPQFVIYGSRSHYVNQQRIPEFKNVFPNLDEERDVCTIQGAGHWLHADKPVEFTEKIAEFIKRIQ